MNCFSLKITFNGWPWQFVNSHWASSLDKSAGQRWGWNPFKVKGAGRFGGWWAFKLGIAASESLSEWVIDLGIGSIRISRKRKP